MRPRRLGEAQFGNDPGDRVYAELAGGLVHGGADGNTSLCKSHRPVHGFYFDGPIVDLPIGPGGSFGRGGPPLKRVKPTDLFPDPDSITVGTASNTRLDWVGRNHGIKHITNGQDIRKTNFLYCDGHVETKHITETLAPRFQWGDACYSLLGGDNIAP